MKSKKATWQKNQKLTSEQIGFARVILLEVQQGESVFKSIRRHPLPDGGYIAKHMLVSAYHALVQEGNLPPDTRLLQLIRMKPMRTLSGVTTVTVLTKPHPCPGTCIFCPSDEQLPKSYLRDEPGAARAFQENFDPSLQVSSRLESYSAIGHPSNKIELLILGGCWTAYPQEYREWFVRRCLDAMNGCDSPDLHTAQHINQNGPHRNVGLVVETRPDEINAQGLVHMRQLGVTKVQMGAQSFDDRILALNHRGHTSQDTLQATALLRAAGFKIVLHWMPNLLGATIDSDREDFKHLWQDGYCPDEIKIYPTQLLENSELFQYWKDGRYQPYSTDQLIQLIADIKTSIPPYCRVNRVIRDIPSGHIVAGNRRSSLRQDILLELARRGQKCNCIRCREIRGETFDPASLVQQDIHYPAAFASEHFIQYSTPQNQLAGYLRLSIPKEQKEEEWFKEHQKLLEMAPELQNTAIIREVHVYGQSVEVGREQSGAAQHIGLGSALLQKAEEITRQNGLRKIVVISAIGTREYYQARGYEPGNLYMIKHLK